MNIKTVMLVQVSNEKKFLNQIHYLRGLAIIFIVGFHTFSSWKWESGELVERFWLSSLYHGTIIFVFISGFLFHHIFIKDFNYKNYLLKKVKFVLLPYLILSIPAIIDELLFSEMAPWKNEFYLSLPDVFKVLFLVLTGKHFGPYWFIPVIFMFFLLAPALVYFDRKGFFYKYIFPLLFVISLFTFQYGHESNPLYSFLYFLPVYILGMFSCKYYNQLMSFRRFLLPVFVVIILIISFLEISGIVTIGKPTGFYQSFFHSERVINLTKLKFVLLSLVLLFIFDYYKKQNVRFLNLLAIYSFSLYFIHLYIIRIVEFIFMKLDINIYYNFWSFPLYVVFILAVNSIAIYIAKLLLRNRSRMIIGS